MWVVIVLLNLVVVEFNNIVCFIGVGTPEHVSGSRLTQTKSVSAARSWSSSYSSTGSGSVDIQWCSA
eukprot:m.422914 g.422914  ORF g.422914 m.422914 type:complete len:67 (+) comp16854_c0_seq6:429-629(+)